MAEPIVDEQLWDDFHRVVNMSSAELEDWLFVQGEHTEEQRDKHGSRLGRRVVAILDKRRADLTADDVEVMSHVVDEVTAERREDPVPRVGEGAWRRRLMSLGHDPLKSG